MASGTRTPEHILAELYQIVGVLRQCEKSIQNREKKREYQRVIQDLDERIKQLRGNASLSIMYPVDLSKTTAMALGAGIGPNDQAALQQLAFTNAVPVNELKQKLDSIQSAQNQLNNATQPTALLGRNDEQKKILELTASNLPSIERNLNTMRVSNGSEFEKLVSNDERMKEYLKRQLNNNSVPLPYLDQVVLKMQQELTKK